MEAGMYLKRKKEEHLKKWKDENFLKNKKLPYTSENKIILKNFDLSNKIHGNGKYKTTVIQQPIPNTIITEKSNETTNESQNETQNSSHEISKTTFNIIDNISVNKQDLFINHIQVLKNQLKQAGIQPVDEIIPYVIGKENLRNAYENLMKNQDNKNLVEYEKWEKFVQNHPDYEQEENEKKQNWHKEQMQHNLEALENQKKLIPDIKEISIENFMKNGLSKKLSKRIMNNMAILLIHKNKEYIEKIHIADLNYKFAFVGLDLIELRSVFISLPDFISSKEKSLWKENLSCKLRQMVDLDKKNGLTKNQMRNSAYNNTESNHVKDLKKTNNHKSKSHKFIHKQSNKSNKMFMLNDILNKKLGCS